MVTILKPIQLQAERRSLQRILLFEQSSIYPITICRYPGGRKNFSNTEFSFRQSSLFRTLFN